MTEPKQTPRCTSVSDIAAVDLLYHLEKQIEAIKETMKATDKAIEARLEAMNELRDQINTERGSYLMRHEYSVVNQRVERDIKELQLSRAELSGKASMSTVFWTGAIAILSLALSGSGLIVVMFK